MSRISFNRRRVTQAGLGALAAIALTAGGFLAFGGGATSANFSSSAPVGVHADAGTLVLESTSSVNFTKLTPGHPQSEQITFTNSGNVKGDELTIGVPVTVSGWSVPAGQTPNWDQVYVTIPGYLSATPVTSAPSTVNIGSINAGASRTITVTVEIRSVSDAADNQFQGVSATGTVTGKARTN